MTLDAIRYHDRTTTEAEASVFLAAAFLLLMAAISNARQLVRIYLLELIYCI